MGLPEDLLRRSMELRGPGYILPSDLEMIVRELMNLRMEIEKIKRALREHGINVD